MRFSEPVSKPGSTGMRSSPRGVTLLRVGALAGAALTASLAARPVRLFGHGRRRIPPIAAPRKVRPALLGQALVALDQHRDMIEFKDRIAIADFSAPSSQPRFYLVDMVNGATTSFLVAHGKGSDPEHSGLAAGVSRTTKGRSARRRARS